MSLIEITQRLRAAEIASNRAVGSVQLIAVSKLQPDTRVRTVLQAGQQVFGENYVQEAAGKWPAFRAEFGPDAGALQVHMIGPLQTNKAKLAVGLFDAIHTVDRASLVQTLAKLAQSRGECPQLFVQVNTGAEPQKAGVLPADLDPFLASCHALDLPIAGLMCIPPEDQPPGPHFAMLAEMAARNGLTGLSMGMSGDFETAIAHGATHVRVGSAIFGARAAG